MTPDARDSTLLGTIASMAKAGAGFVADMVAQLMAGFRAAVMAPLVLAMGCQAEASGTFDKAAVQPEVAVVAKAEKAEPEGPKQLGFFSITFYYVVGEEEVLAKQPKKPANDNQAADAETELAAIAPPPEMVTIYTKDKCEPIAEVRPEFAQQLKIQGTGKLKDGRVLNVWGHCRCETSPCFKVTEQQWGTAGSGRPLQPFRTVAVDPRLIKLGSLLYVPLLEGRTMPGRAPWGGFVHDGCVVADDTGGGIKDQQLDLFVGRKGWFLGMSGHGGSHAWARHVPVFDGSKLCQRKGRVVSRKTGSI